MLSGKNRFSNSIIDFFFPRYCLNCRKNGTFLCQNCENKIKTIQKTICPYCFQPSILGQTHISCQKKYGLDGLISLYQYRPVINQIITHWKYSPYIRQLQPLIKKLIIRQITPHPMIPQEKNLIIPVPLNHWKRKKRGFNQSEFIAQTIHQIWNIPCDNELLQRQFHLWDQAQLKNRHQREKNIKNQFRLNPDKKTELSQFSRIYLADDIYTSGSTLKEICYLLKKNGAKNVWGFTFAR